jgi:hypothetical protein
MQNVRKAVLSVSFAAVFILAGTTAHATCPTVTTYSASTTWYQLAVDSTCLSSSGVTPVSVVVLPRVHTGLLVRDGL